MNPVEIIRKKRDGKKLTKDEISFFINGYLNGKIPDYQMSAFLMAVYFQNMDFEETTYLTEIMLNSGHIIDLSDIPGIKVDKHSTGGVGDKVSLILAPIVAAAGVPVPMISGRGLGHTGGTLDKLESIPGFRTNLSVEEYKKVISEIGLVMIGQTEEIAPADKKIYALRDVTATVGSIKLKGEPSEKINFEFLFARITAEIKEPVDKSGIDLLFFTGTIGYRYQPKGRGIIFRIGYTPVISKGGISSWIGLSVGYKFY